MLHPKSRVSISELSLQFALNHHRRHFGSLFCIRRVDFLKRLVFLQFPVVVLIFFFFFMQSKLCWGNRRCKEALGNGSQIPTGSNGASVDLEEV